MKIIVSTSNAYRHLIPAFEYLYLKYWGDMNIEIVGYEKPETSLPFYSMGKQGDVSEWSTDLRRYFEKQDQYVIWLFDDTLIRSVNKWGISKADKYAKYLLGFDKTTPNGVGRFDLTKDIQNREHIIHAEGIIEASQNSRYRLSTQPSIWNRDYLLQYLTPGLDPWRFETQDPKNDGWAVLGIQDYPVRHNEGIRKTDLYNLDLNKLPAEDIAYLKNHNSWIK